MREITFDGFEGGALTVPLINVWADWEKREQIVAVVPHGATGKLISRDGMKCEVETEGGVVGFVTFWFIRELKGDPARKFIAVGDEIVILKPVAIDALATYVERLGLNEGADVERLLELEGDERQKAEDNIKHLAMFCIGRGVANGPKSVRRRARWLEGLFGGPVGVLREVIFPIMALTAEVSGA